MNGRFARRSPSPATASDCIAGVSLLQQTTLRARSSRKARAWLPQVFSSANPKMNTGTMKLE